MANIRSWIADICVCEDNMLGDLSVVAISISVIILCWVVVRLNQKLEQAMYNLKSHKEIGSKDNLGEKELAVTVEQTTSSPT